MKKITLLVLSILCFTALTNQANAQDGYTYTLVDNGSFNYTVAAVPNTSTSNFATSVQSYGFTIIVPDGVTATLTTSLGNGASDTFFDGNNVSQPTIDGYLITETLGSPIPLPAPSASTNTPLVTIQVNGTPTSGAISILVNDSALAIAVASLKSFMQADMIDDSMAIYTNVVDPNASGLSGVTSYNFNTLSIEENTITNLQVSIYPNPAATSINISSALELTKVEVFDLLGKRVLETLQTSQIKVDHLPAGLYLVKVYGIDGSATKKIIIE